MLIVLLATTMLAPLQDSPNELKALSGSWKLEQGEINGAVLPREILKEFKLVLKDNRYELFSNGPKDEGTITVDPIKKPRQMVIKGTNGPNRGKTIYAIYELSEGQLRICYDISGKAFPTEFTAPVNSNRFFGIYRQPRE